MTDDLSLYNYLALRVRASGEPRTRSAYFVNIQTDGPVPSDIWQHRLYLGDEADGKTWEDVIVRFSFSFVNTIPSLKHVEYRFLSVHSSSQAGARPLPLKSKWVRTKFERWASRYLVETPEYLGDTSLGSITSVLL